MAYQVCCQSAELNSVKAVETDKLEYGRGSGNSQCSGEMRILGRTSVAKARYWAETDTEGRKLGERKGLDTPVVLAVNDGN